MIEVFSLESLLERPRYWGGGYHDTGRRWIRGDDVALKALCEEQASLERSAAALGRSPTSLAHRASDTALRLPLEWKDAIMKSRPRILRQPLMQYPFIAKVRGEHSDLLAVNALVPHGLPHHMRADVCQEIMLAVWEGKVSIDELRCSPKLIGGFVRDAKKANYEAGGYALSLDTPMPDGRSWYDVLPDQHDRSALGEKT